jgi:tetraacyldisaccharide 4'-kinase
MKASLLIANIEAFCRKAWQHRGWFWLLMWPFSAFVLLLIWLKRFLNGWFQKPAYRANRPVVVVGNVILGGAGKTPVVMALVEHLKQQQLAVGVVSRGHGRKPHSPAHLVSESSTAAQAGDEPLLIWRRCQVPVTVAAQRSQAIDLLLEKFPQIDVIVADDGLQHDPLHHDLAVCVFDERGLGNGAVFPAGPLREPWPRHLRGARRQWILGPRGNRFTLEMNGIEIDRQLSDAAINTNGQQRPLSDWHGKPVGAFAGIAKPEAFFQMLQDRGLHLQQTIGLPDHVNFDPAWNPGLSLDWLCTEKDAVKLQPSTISWWAVPLAVHLPEYFWQEFDQELRKLSLNHGHKAA